MIRPGGTLVSIAVPRPPLESRTGDIRSIWFVVTPNRAQLTEIARLIDTGNVEPIVEQVLSLARGREAFEAGLNGHGPGKLVLDVLGR